MLDPHTAYLARDRFASLDGIRALAILAVIWHHSAPGYPGLPITSNGFLGVDIFFVLSGFLIVTLLLRERNRRGGISLRAFYLRRTLRIFPVYYGLLLLLTLRFVASRAHPEAARFFGALPYNLSYSSNWIPDSANAAGLAITWSLATEEQFYLVWPFLQKILPHRWLLGALALLLVVNQCINFRLADGLFSGWIGAHYPHLDILQATFTPILLGVALAHALHSPALFRIISRVLGNRIAPLLALAAVLIACNRSGELGGAPRLIIQLLMTAFLASVVVREDHSARPLLASLPLRSIGTVSYGMYLFHVFLTGPAGKIALAAGLGGRIPKFLLTVLLTFAAAQVSFRFYEQPFLRLKGRVERWRTATLRVSPAPASPETQPAAQADGSVSRHYQADQETAPAGMHPTRGARP